MLAKVNINLILSTNPDTGIQNCYVIFCDEFLFDSNETLIF